MELQITSVEQIIIQLISLLLIRGTQKKRIHIKTSTQNLGNFTVRAAQHLDCVRTLEIICNFQHFPF